MYRSTSNEAMCGSGENIYSCSNLSYKLESVHEHEEPSNVLDMTTRFLKEKNTPSLESLFRTNVRYDHGILGPFLDLAHAAHPLLACHVDCSP